MPRVFVGAGSNVDPLASLRAARAALERSFGAVRCSRVYRGAAVGGPAPEYLNVVIAFTTERGPGDLKTELRAIEDRAGRDRGARAALCTLDLDLLVYGARVDAERRLPHADVLRRSFVLAPFADLEPTLEHPVTGERLGDARRRLAELMPRVIEIGELGAAG